MSLVCIRGPLRELAGGRGEHELGPGTVVEVLRELERGHPALAGWIVDERGLIRHHLHVFVNGELAEEDMALSAGDRVEIVTAITGG